MGPSTVIEVSLEIVEVLLIKGGSGAEKKTKKYKHFRSICLQRIERVFLQNPRKNKSVTLLNSINAIHPSNDCTIHEHRPFKNMLSTRKLCSETSYERKERRNERKNFVLRGNS